MQISDEKVEKENFLWSENGKEGTSSTQWGEPFHIIETTDT